MSGRPLRIGLLALLVLVVAAAGLFAWRTARRAPTGPPVLTAGPNPVPAGDGLGSTTITWSTGDGSVGQVYVSENGGPEALVTQGQGGSEQANWIGSGTTYEFRLYASRDRTKPLAAVTVTGQQGRFEWLLAVSRPLLRHTQGSAPDRSAARGG